MESAQAFTASKYFSAQAAGPRRTRGTAPPSSRLTQAGSSWEGFRPNTSGALPLDPLHQDSGSTHSSRSRCSPQHSGPESLGQELGPDPRLGDLLRLSTAATPFRLQEEGGSAPPPEGEGGVRDPAPEGVEPRDTTQADSPRQGPSAVDEEAVLLDALARCDGLSEASSLSADLAEMLEGAIQPRAGDRPSRNRNAYPLEAGSRLFGKKRRSQESCLASKDNTEHVLTKNILDCAKDIVTQQLFMEQHQKGDHLLFLQLHTMFRSSAFSQQRSYGNPTCFCMVPVYEFPPQGEASPKLGAHAAVAVGTSRGKVLLYNALWNLIAVLSSKNVGTVCAVSISTDRTTLACSIQKKIMMWSLHVALPTTPTKALKPLFSSSAISDNSLQALQHVCGMPYALLGMEEHTGALHFLSLTSFLGSPFSLTHECIVSASMDNPSTSVDILPCPSDSYFHASVKGSIHTPPPFLELLGEHQEMLKRYKSWGGLWSSAEPPVHIVAVGNTQGVTLLLCNFVTLAWTTLTTWDVPKLSKFPPLVHLIPYEDCDHRRIALAVTSEGALYIFDLLSLVTEGETAPLRLRHTLPWNSSTAITGLCAVGNGSLLVLDETPKATFIDVSFGVLLEEHFLPFGEFLQGLPVNSLCGPRPEGASNEKSAAHSSLGAVLCTKDMYVIGFTFLTWRERVEGMVHHHNYTGALEYIRELMLEIRPTTGNAEESKQKRQYEKALLNYMEIICQSFVENTLEENERWSSKQKTTDQIQKTVYSILSYCQRDIMKNVFWDRVVGFVQQYHREIQIPVFLAVKQGIATGKLTFIPARFVKSFSRSLWDHFSQTSGMQTNSKMSPRENAKNADAAEEDSKQAFSPAATRHLENILLRLKGDMNALYSVSQAYSMPRLAIQITAFQRKHYAHALHAALEYFNVHQELQQGSEEVPYSKSLAVEFLSRLMKGHTFAKNEEIPVQEQETARRQVLHCMYHRSCVLSALLFQDPVKATQVILDGIFRSFTVPAKKRKREDCVHPVLLALRLFVHILLLDETEEARRKIVSLYSEEDMLDLQNFTPVFYKKLCSSPPAEREGIVSQTLSCFCDILLPSITTLSASANEDLGVECNWRWFLPVLSQYFVLRYQNCDSLMKRIQIQQVLSEYFRSPHLKMVSLLWWKNKCRAARMARCASAICFRDGHFVEAIDYYMDPESQLEDPALSKDVFSVLHTEMLNLMMVSDTVEDRERQINQLRCAVINRVVPLGNVDSVALANFYIKYPARNEDDLFVALEGSTKKLLSFLQQLIDSKDTALQRNAKLQNQYIELQCMHSPSKVYQYLRENDDEIQYDRAAAIECSRRHHVYSATIYLLTVGQRLHDALDYTCEVVQKLMHVALSERQKKVFRPSEKESPMEQLPQLKEVLELGVEAGAAANDESCWMRLLHLFDASFSTALKSATAGIGPEEQNPSSVTRERVDAADWYRALCQAGLAIVMKGIGNSLGSAPIFQHIFRSMDVQHWIKALPPFITLLEEEVNMYKSATEVSKMNEAKWMKEFVRATRVGVLAGKPSLHAAPETPGSTCFICRKDLRSSEPGGVDHSLRLLPCGHSYHDECLTFSAGLTPCPECTEFSCFYPKENTSHILPRRGASSVTTHSSVVSEGEVQEHRYNDLQRLRGMLDHSGERTSTLKMMLSSLPRPVRRPLSCYSFASPDATPLAAPHLRTAMECFTGYPNEALSPDGEEGDDFQGMTNEDFLSIFGGGS